MIEAPRPHLGFPAGLMMIVGIGLVLWSLHGLDEKHGLLNNKLAPKAADTSGQPTSP